MALGTYYRETKDVDSYENCMARHRSIRAGCGPDQRVAHVSRAMNGFATELRDVIDDLMPGESLVIVNVTGRHELIAAKAP